MVSSANLHIDIVGCEVNFLTLGDTGWDEFEIGVVSRTDFHSLKTLRKSIIQFTTEGFTPKLNNLAVSRL